MKIAITSFVEFWGFGLHKTFWGTTKKCENKNLIWFFLFGRNSNGKG